jgi:hypothetical protein
LLSISTKIQNKDYYFAVNIEARQYVKKSATLCTVETKLVPTKKFIAK